MRKLLLSYFFILGSFIHIIAQPSQALITIGGYAYDDTQKALQLSDSGYILLGSTFSYGVMKKSMKITRLDKNMNLKWAKVTSGTNVSIDAKDITKTWDGGYAVTGFLTKSGYTYIYVARMDSLADTLWTRTYGLNNQGWMGMSLIQTSDHGFVINGSGTSTNWSLRAAVTLKFDSVGTLLWKQIVSDQSHTGTHIVQTNSGGYVYTGKIDSTGSGPFRMNFTELDATGHVVRIKAIGSHTFNKLSYGNGITKVNNGYVICGSTDAYGAGMQDIYVAKTDTAGNLLWTKVIGGTKNDLGNKIIATSDGGLALTGATYSFNDTTNADLYILKLDSSGNFLWMTTIGGTGEEWGLNLEQTTDDNFIVSGRTFSFGDVSGDGLFAKFDANGFNCQSVSVTPNISTGGYSVDEVGTINQAGNFISNNYYFIAIDSITQVCSTITHLSNNEFSHNAILYPNPNIGQFTFQLPEYDKDSVVEIYNILGDMIYEHTLTSQEIFIDLKYLSNGIYMYKVPTANGVIQGKFIISK